MVNTSCYKNYFSNFLGNILKVLYKEDYSDW